MSDINIGQITEALNDKMDRDAHNVQSPSAVVVDKQDPTSENNYTWYRKYSDGWVEQGGHASSVPYGGTNITFPIPFSNSNYALFFTPVHESVSNTAGCGSVGEKTSVGATLKIYGYIWSSGQWNSSVVLSGAWLAIGVAAS